jgi:hypothetical protein
MVSYALQVAEEVGPHELSTFEVNKVGTTNNPADMFTKPVPQSKFQQFLNLLNVRSCLLPLEGQALRQSRLIWALCVTHLAHLVRQVHLVHLVIWRRFKSRWRFVEICLELVLGKCPTSDNMKKYSRLGHINKSLMSQYFLHQ